MTPIDCGLIRSCRASSLELAGPPRSRRDSVEDSASVSSSLGEVCLSLRYSMPMATRSAAATS